MAAIATVTGTAIRPGISKNGRLYTAEAIGRMVDRAQARIAEGGMPLTTLTHHEAGDDSTRIVGRITSLAQEADGSARYTAVLTDTGHGRDIHSLISGPNPVLRGVSIRGAWVGRVRREQHDGRTVETGDDLELDGLDYTRKPGVEGAGIDSVEPIGSEPRESDGTARVPITESAPEATVTITEADGSAEEGPFADPGYQKDKKKRYPLSSKSQAKSAWSYINQADNARLYTSAQLKRIKGRIAKALKGFGVQVAAQEGWLIDPAAAVSEALAECWDMDPARGSLYLSLTNGPTTVTVSSAVLDPHDLDLVGRAAMAGACDALMALDPDMDADIDLPGAPTEGDDEEEPMQAAPAADLVAAVETAATLAPPGLADGITPATTPAPEPPAAGTPAEPEEEPAMADTTPEAATPAAVAPAVGGSVTLTNDQFAQLLAAVAPRPAAPVEAAPAAPAAVAEAAPAAAAPAEPAAPVAEAPTPAAPVAESEDERIARLVKEGIARALPAAVQEHVVQNGPPARKGLVAQTSENPQGLTESGIPAAWPQKPLHEYTDEEWRQHVAPTTVSAILGNRAPAPAAQ
ncbi:DUF6582 domain-containing protein [Peterkaempfera griseoplana]|uniref:DUF6582 domain-containing protein n=1 Tax=Peterkaempfera griseoplana TaxID=66896 RepID=UPI0006E1D8C8|nr:DUF6582 domain-containing protein [Peterkaempfera griseoplana]